MEHIVRGKSPVAVGLEGYAPMLHLFFSRGSYIFLEFRGGSILNVVSYSYIYIYIIIGTQKVFHQCRSPQILLPLES